MLVDHLLKIKKECKNWNKQDIQDIFTDKFQHDMAYGHFTDLARRTALDKVLRDKEFRLLKIQNMVDIKEVLLLW